MFKRVKNAQQGAVTRFPIKTYFLLHGLLLIYSIASVMSKAAAARPFLSSGFVLFYGVVLGLLFLYAIGWQQVLKKLPLSVAYVNKSIVVMWGFFWGSILFKERITPGMFIGSLLVICGIFFVVSENE